MFRKVMIAGLAISLVLASSLWAQTNNGPKMANLGYLQVGPAFWDLDELNDSLQVRGLDDFSNTVLAIGLGNYTMIQRVLVDFQINSYWWGDEKTNGTEGSLVAGNAFLNLGINILPSYMNLQLYPLVGFGGGVLRLHVHDDEASWTDALNNPNGVGTDPLYQWSMLLNFGGGLDYLISVGPIQRMVVGLRGGYIYDPTDSDWNQQGPNLTGAPEQKQSNGYIMVTIGKGLSYSMWQRLASALQ